jgi:hypothetical protein
MSVSPGHVLHVIAAQLLARLDRYEADVAQLLRSWPDDAQFQRVWEHVEHIRAYSGNVPDVRVQATSVLVAHAELMRLLCRTHDGYEVGLGRDIARCHANHRDCVSALRYRLQWVVNRAAERAC